MLTPLALDEELKRNACRGPFPKVVSTFWGSEVPTLAECLLAVQDIISLAKKRRCA